MAGTSSPRLRQIGLGFMTYLHAVAARAPPGHLRDAPLGKAGAATEPDASQVPLEAPGAQPSPLLRERALCRAAKQKPIVAYEA